MTIKHTTQLLVAAGLLTTAALTGTASAADLKLGLNSSLGANCQVAGVRVSFQQGIFGLFGQGAYCTGTVSGGSYGGGVSLDFAHFNNFTTYALLGADSLPTGSSAVYAGLGARYSTILLPVEGYVELGVQRINSTLTALYGPRVAAGLNYRVSIPDLQPGTGGTSSVSSAGPDRSGEDGAVSSAPASCNISPEQDRASATSVARAAANRALADAASAYGALYSNVSYSVNLDGATISGGTARVSGSVTVSATDRSGQRVGGSYGGTVNLVRSGCTWQATGYNRSSEE